MSTFGESAGTSVTSEVRSTRQGAGSDDIDPLPSGLGTSLTIRERSWQDPAYEEADAEYEQLVLSYARREALIEQTLEREAIEDMSMFVNRIIDRFGVQGVDMSEKRLETANGEIRRTEAVGGDYVASIQADGTIEYEFQEKPVYSYFFRDAMRVYENEDGSVDGYCRNWTSESEKITSCTHEARHEPAASVREAIEARFAEYIPGRGAESAPVSRFARMRGKLGFLLGKAATL